MNPFLVILIIGIIAITFILLDSRYNLVTKPQSEPNNEISYPYTKRNLLTKTEYVFFNVLKQFCDNNNLYFCPKVRMEDFLTVTDKQNNSKYRGYIKSRHIDFLICDKALHILCGIELDDKSHDSPKAQATDNFKNKVFEQIQIPLFRIKTTSNYNTELNNILIALNLSQGEKI